MSDEYDDYEEERDEESSGYQPKSAYEIIKRGLGAGYSSDAYLMGQSALAGAATGQVVGGMPGAVIGATTGGVAGYTVGKTPQRIGLVKKEGKAIKTVLNGAKRPFGAVKSYLSGKED